MAEIADLVGDLTQSSKTLGDSCTTMKSEVQSNQVVGSKRPHPDDDDDENVGGNANCKRNKLDNGTEPEALAPTLSATSDPASISASTTAAVVATTAVPTLSKNQLRKQRQRELWIEKKKEKKVLRNQKRKDKQQQKRIEKEAEIAAAAAEGREPVFDEPERPPKPTQVQAPVTVIIDCQFEKYMMEKELVSLSNQVTRCYSDNRNSRYPVHMFVSSYGGYMKERNETILQNQFKNWKNVHFVEGDFAEAATQAKKLMGTAEDQVIEALAQGKEGDAISFTVADHDGKKKHKSAPTPEPEAADVEKSIVYLTADSPYTIDRLEPGTSYVIGGIIDKNREKGLCYKIAREKNVRTAKLPIGDFMVMQSRHVLATNHVMEIMLQWLETGDWGKAFVKVIPTRKGGKLKGGEGASTPEDQPANDAITADDAFEMTPPEPNVTSPKPSEPENPTAQKPHSPIQVKGNESDDSSMSLHN
ncbi:uncharacterized protein GGS22DRAFT_114530 [Annulohypoxylon maeteangense]|uniref:uncharacterized protein n=1 Tax=Annulohypoxylon maeteangense TaxID=1927788 RepID=UPI00200736A8|nr:uncharacterized protein GGS22DRAFT_114530 [Annulohypoxylon maeteangense]KAI0886516.1 hypothetical protein GGS22DRAFT_114530 [Annulohypoxylon maeteangense]